MSKQNVDITDHLNTPAQESFRVLSTNLELNKKHGKLKVVSIISFNPGEGKTSVAINSAIAAAKSGVKVLYVDADLRKPGNLKRHGDESTKGLTNYHEEIEVDDIICQTCIDNLKYVTAGNRLVDPVEFLSSQIFVAFLDRASHQYGMVFIDSPSIGCYVDGAIIASKASGVLIVTRSYKTRYKDIERIKWQMENVGANIIGIVVNRVERVDYKSYFILHKNYKYTAKNFKQVEINT